ncbi:hypothetical protein HPB50_024222 [Hyalomma asiaticum]|uniref:Uncharacterized protein n=1 Tax=Hyalomma asiaticum TaxID=266040 RepID=A0ACB7SIA3_HYAAI|nr:hypothetical protein HPB50_024222 [Hyalomma asiaticum]
MTQETSDSVDYTQEMQELLEARINTDEGTWVQCDQPDCNKWRYLADVIDPSELPDKWYCSMNSDPKRNSCNAEEESPPEDELLDAKYFVGSIVWAKVNTYPWWPAMIDDDPDLGVYEWRDHDHGLPIPGYYRKLFDAAVGTAEIALKLPVAERIKNYCFLNKYQGTRKSSIQAPKGNTTTQAEPNCDKPPAGAETDNATLLMPQHKAPDNKARDSAGAGFVLSIPTFDSAEDRPECFDVNSLIEFLDEDETTENKPVLGTLNKAGENFDVSKTNQLLLPCDPMDLEHPMDTLPIEEPMKDAGYGSNQPQQSEPMESRSTPEVAVVEKPVPRADSETEVHVTVLAGTGFRSSQQAEQSSKVSLGATGVTTSSKASTQAYKASSTSKVGSIESGTKDTTREAWNKSGSPETSNSEQAYKVKEVTKTTNKENHEPPSATARGTAPAKKGKPVSKPNRVPQEMVPPKSAAAKKPAFKVPKRDVASKMEARLSKTAALLSETQTKANTSTAAESKQQASLVNKKKAISGKATEAMPQAKAADTSETHSTAGTSKAAEAQATLSHVNAAKPKAGTNKAAHTDMQAMPENADDALQKLSASYTVDSEDSDFESLSNTQDLTFEDTLSSISQSLEMSQEEDSDFASLEGIDGSQTFSKEE